MALAWRNSHMKKILFAAVVAAGAAFAGGASAAPIAPAALSVEQPSSGQIQIVRHGGRHMHRGWGKRHHGWRRGHHYGWRHHGVRRHHRHWR